MEIIPAIDIIDGKCVRLSQGDYQQKKEYSASPLEVAKSYENAGIKRLHLVDLDGAKQKKVINLSVLRQIASLTKLQIDFGGGVQSDQDIEMVFDAGARQVTAGSIAVKQPDLVDKWITQYGPEKIILGADVKGEQIAVSGWTEKSDINLFDFLTNYLPKGIREVICTDVSRDGMLQGPSIDLYKRVLNHFPDVKLVASGGVSSLKDLQDLKKIGVAAVIIGKALYEYKISLNNLKPYL